MWVRYIYNINTNFYYYNDDSQYSQQYLLSSDSIDPSPSLLASLVLCLLMLPSLVRFPSLPLSAYPPAIIAIIVRLIYFTLLLFPLSLWSGFYSLLSGFYVIWILFVLYYVYFPSAINDYSFYPYYYCNPIIIIKLCIYPIVGYPQFSIILDYWLLLASRIYSFVYYTSMLLLS